MDGYIIRYDQNSYEIAPRGIPYKQPLKLYRGDEISISLKGIHLTDAKDPFDFGIFDSIEACFKPFPESHKSFCATDDNILLSQSQEALDYDSAEGNDLGTTKDELHFLDPEFELLEDYHDDVVYLDIQAQILDSTYTFIQFNIRLIEEVTQ